MNNGGDAAEQIVRMSLNGFEVAAKITGEGAKNIAILLYTILKDGKQTKGKARLTAMLRSGKELKVFTMKISDVAKFQKEAKRYGVLYCVLKDKDNKNPNAMVDIIARAEDASKISRIVERFNLASVDTGHIVQEAQKSKAEKHKEKDAAQAEPERDMPEKSEADQLIDEILEKPLHKEEPHPVQTDKSPEKNSPANPSVAKTEKSPLSEPTLDGHDQPAPGVAQTMGTKKPSVRAEMERLRKQVHTAPDSEKEKAAEKQGDAPKKQPDKTVHTQPKQKKKTYKKAKER